MTNKIERATIERYHGQYHAELFDRVMPFWLANSLDREHGGYFNCLDRDGKVWDTAKHMWLQGREVWMMSKLYNAMGRDPKFLEAATIGAKFIRRHGRTAGNRVYFSLTREGTPLSMQRKMFSECFYVMALAEYARAANDPTARAEARDVFASVIEFAKDPKLVGRPVFAGAAPASSLAVPMILLNLIEEVNDPGENNYQDTAKWCVQQIDKHYRPELKLILETVGANGELLNSPEGRLVNPGHAIECGWFLLAYAEKTKDAALRQKSLDMINWSLDYGWDREFGGILYFLDREGYSPSQLEWNMKLWWPHCETLVALLMAYEATGEASYFAKFEEISAWTFAHFPDVRFGEWYGYLDRRGDVTHRFKGGPYKGCFHVPRALFLCERILARLAGRK